jgi:hypothetical protein
MESGAAETNDRFDEYLDVLKGALPASGQPGTGPNEHSTGLVRVLRAASPRIREASSDLARVSSAVDWAC